MRNDSKGIPAEIEHLLVYSKKSGWSPKRLPRTAEMDLKYKNPDNDPNGEWQNTSAFAPGAATHQGMVYAIQHPFTGKMIYPTMSACWRYSQEAMLEYMNGWTPYKLVDLQDEEERAKICGVRVDEIREGVRAIVLADSLETAQKNAKKIYERGQWPRFYFTNGGKGGIRRKTYKDKVGGRPVTNFWPFSETGHTDEAKKELLSVFGGRAVFDTPKPARLVQRVLQIVTESEDIILDSFAGSGTTAHAVLKMNKEDGGNRKFILIEMEDYADGITAERVKKVINGYGEEKNAVKGTGGSFSYYELGGRLFLEDGTLNPDMDAESIRKYIWYTETKKPLPDGLSDDNPYFLAADGETAYYFFYEKEEITTLDKKFLNTLKMRAENYVIYADKCVISEKGLQKNHITFKKIPRDIVKI